MRNKFIQICLSFSISLASAHTMELSDNDLDTIDRIVYQVNNGIDVNKEFDNFSTADWKDPSKQRRFVIQKTLKTIHENPNETLNDALDNSIEDLKKIILKNSFDEDISDILSENIKNTSEQIISAMELDDKVKQNNLLYNHLYNHDAETYNKDNKDQRNDLDGERVYKETIDDDINEDKTNVNNIANEDKTNESDIIENDINNREYENYLLDEAKDNDNDVSDNIDDATLDLEENDEYNIETNDETNNIFSKGYENKKTSEQGSYAHDDNYDDDDNDDLNYYIDDYDYNDDNYDKDDKDEEMDDKNNYDDYLTDNYDKNRTNNKDNENLLNGTKKQTNLENEYSVKSDLDETFTNKKLRTNNNMHNKNKNLTISNYNEFDDDEQYDLGQNEIYGIDDEYYDKDNEVVKTQSNPSKNNNNAFYVMDGKTQNNKTTSVSKNVDLKNERKQIQSEMYNDMTNLLQSLNEHLDEANEKYEH